VLQTASPEIVTQRALPAPTKPALGFVISGRWAERMDSTEPDRPKPEGR
jgi:hypothetical protein